MIILRPNENTQRVMISTPSHFVGEFVSDKILITHAFPQLNDAYGWQALSDSKNPYKRSYFIASFIREPDKDKEHRSIIPDYSVLGEYLSVFLSVLYGKRFDNHGAIEQNGRFGLPSMSGLRPCKYVQYPFNNDKPRKNLNIELNLDKVKSIEKIIDLDFDGGRAGNVFFAAAKSYLEALRTIDYDPENAFISLVMSGEILGDFYKKDFTAEELYDENTRKQFERITVEIIGGEKIVSELKGRLFQVKRVFTRVLLKLLNSKFFDGYEGEITFLGLSEKGIKRKIMYAYDLRSYYIHTGARFGKYIEPINMMNEVCPGLGWVMEDKRLSKLLKHSPTFLGMERIIRFCLLRFLNINNLIHHDDLEGLGIDKSTET